MSIKSKKHTRKVPLPGFPWDGKFEDMMAVREYFSHDRLQCLLCGRDFGSLGYHIVRSHKISLDDYKEKFGLPWSYGLAGKSLKKNQSKVLKKTWRAGKLQPDPSLIKNLHIYREQKNRSYPLAVKNAFVQRGLKRIGLERKWDAADYEKFLTRIKTGRTPPEVGRDKDMPAVSCFQKYLSQNPEFRQRFEVIWDNLPFKVQSRGRRFGKRVKNRVVELRLKGHTFPQIGHMLGLSEDIVRNIWFDFKNGSTGIKRKELQDYEKSLRWDPKIYDEFLRRIATGRTATEVSKDKDMPSRTLFDIYVQKTLNSGRNTRKFGRSCLLQCR